MYILGVSQQEHLAHKKCHCSTLPKILLTDLV